MILKQFIGVVAIWKNVESSIRNIFLLFTPVKRSSVQMHIRRLSWFRARQQTEKQFYLKKLQDFENISTFTSIDSSE